MDFAALCTVFAVLKLFPSKSQFFLHDSVMLSCVDNKNSSDWTIKRTTNNNRRISTECPLKWGKRNESGCLINALYQFDSGQYWCESRSGACSEIMNVTVTDGPVMLESPGLRVAEGEMLILRCILNMASSRNFTTFYKDGLLIGSSLDGIFTIGDVSKSDEGLYKCNITGVGESPESWVLVRGNKGDSFHFNPTNVLLPVVAVCFSLGVAMLRRRKLKAKADDDVSYTDVTFLQKVLPETNAEITSDPTLYSTIKLGDS